MPVTAQPGQILGRMMMMNYAKHIANFWDYEDLVVSFQKQIYLIYPNTTPLNKMHTPIFIAFLRK
jgi:hypothetical protein